MTYRNGAPVRLQELGRVLDSVQNDKIASWVNDTRAISLTVQRQPGVNTVKVNVVWDPPWSPQMIHPEGRERLGMD